MSQSTSGWPADPPRVLAFVCDADSMIESTATQSEYSQCLTPGHRLLDLLSSSREPDLPGLWNEMAGSGIHIQSEVQLTLFDGQPPFMMLFHAIPLHYGKDEGKFLATLCSGFRPVSAGPDEVLRCRAVLNTAVDSIITIDSRGIISSVNPATEKMFGYPENELMGRNISLLMPEPYAGEHDTYLSRYLETGKASIIGSGRRVSGQKKNGEEFPVHLAVSEFTVRGHHFFTGILRDLTELEQAQRQLLQSTRLAAIGQMVTGLAHESRNALQRAQACMDMLSLDLQNAPEQLNLARRATTALQDLHRLYEEVRGYAAPIHLEYRDCLLSSIWRKEWENLAAARKDKDIRLIESVDSQDLRCQVDVHRVEQVFRNVLENAIQACETVGTITVCCTPGELKGNPVVQISIRDTGVGMTPQTAQQIFEPFFTTRQRGTGLGMAIVQRIMQAHGGTVSAAPGESGGAEIIITLPTQPAVRNGVRS